jgi:photosystem II stability/assembly factor-like uncharacterized protein
VNRVRVLVATEDGLYAIAGDGNARRLVSGDVAAIAPSVEGRTQWLVVGGHQLVELHGDEAREVGSAREDMTSVVGTRDDVFVGTVGAHVLHIVDGHIVRSESFDDIDGRDHWTQPWGAPGDVRSFATDGDSTVYVNVHVGGILRTGDRGETWVQTIDHEIDVHQVARAADGRLFAATGAGGLGFSDDGATTWSFVTQGLHGTYLRAVAPVRGGAVVSASTGPFTHSGALYRWYDDGRVFERCDRGIPATFDGNVDSHWIAARDDVVACVGPNATVYRSDDAGQSWRVLATGVSHPHAVFVDRD